MKDNLLKKMDVKTIRVGEYGVILTEKLLKGHQGRSNNPVLTIHQPGRDPIQWNRQTHKWVGALSYGKKRGFCMAFSSGEDLLK